MLFTCIAIKFKIKLMKLTKEQIVIFGVAALIVIFFILIFLGVIPGLRTKNTVSKFAFNFWGIDSPATFEKIIADYQKLRPNVTVKYQQKNESTYENDLINDLAAGQGPDIFVIKNTWLLKHKNKISPLPETQLSFQNFQQIFPDVVAQDFSFNKTIYALPLYIDTLALYYNKDFFDQKSVAVPPATWQEFLDLIPQLRELNYAGEIVRAAAALGGSPSSISQATDILNLLMLQKGTQMIDAGATRANFNDQNGKVALDFYTRFANPASPYYTWSDSFGNSLDSFGQGKTAMMFDYGSEAQNIKAKNPFLNFVISPMLQFNSNQAVNFAQYWGYTATSKLDSTKSAWAWDFVLYMTTNHQSAETYFETTKKPPALRILINKYINDPDMGIFAKQALTSRSWLQPDDQKVAQIFSEMISGVTSGRLSSATALQQAADQITQLLKQ